MNKSWQFIKIILLSCITILLIGILLFFARGGTTRGRYAYTYTDSDSQSSSQMLEFSKSDVKSVDITWDLGKVAIQPTDEDYICINQINYDNNDIMYVSAEITNKKLVIKNVSHGKRYNFFRLNYDRCDVEILLPRQTYENLKVKSALGDIGIENIKIDDLDIDADAGRIVVEKVEAKDIVIDASMGSVEISDVKGTSLACKVSAGELRLQKCEFDDFSAKADMGALNAVLTNAPKKMDLNVSMGDLRLTIPENDGFTIKADVSMGNFSSDFGSNTNGESTYKNGSRSYKVDVSMGNLTIKKSS